MFFLSAMCYEDSTDLLSVRFSWTRVDQLGLSKSSDPDDTETNESMGLLTIASEPTFYEQRMEHDRQPLYSVNVWRGNHSISVCTGGFLDGDLQVEESCVDDMFDDAPPLQSFPPVNN